MTITNFLLLLFIGFLIFSVIKFIAKSIKFFLILGLILCAYFMVKSGGCGKSKDVTKKVSSVKKSVKKKAHTLKSAKSKVDKLKKTISKVS